MPKLKTKSSAKKRLYITGSGKVMFKKAGRQHLLRRKSKKRKRHLSNPSVVHYTNMDNVRLMLHI